MASRRIYITLNSQKEKDKIIENYLSQSYSESDAIKEAIYRLATNSTERVQNKPKRERESTKDKGDNKVLKGAINNEEAVKDTNDNSTETVQNITNDYPSINLNVIDEEVVHIENDDEVRANELNDLLGFYQ